MRGVKGFGKDMKCRGFQFEEGKEYSTDEKIECCKSGFHSVKKPIDVFNYYGPANSIFREIEADGTIERHSDDSKIASSKIKIGAVISLKAMIEASIKFVFEKCDFTKENKTGDRGAASQTGDRGAASQTGNQGAASQTGYQGAASQTGNQGAASQTGDRGAASQTGDRGAASQTGYYGAASQTGDRGAASQTGNQGAASQTGYQGAASQTGYRGAASQTGYYGAASQTGDRGAASQTGYQGAASQTGDQGAASQTGNYGAAITTGVESSAKINIVDNFLSGTAIALGKNSKASAPIGGWLVISEWKLNKMISVKSIKVDGKKIKENVFYTVKNGKFIKAK
jgi:hypothetical protein